MSTMNLLPDYYVKQRFRYRVDMVCVVLFAIVMGGLMAAEKFTSLKSRDVEVEYSATNAEYSSAASFMKDNFFQLQGRKTGMLKDAKAALEKEQSIPRSYVLAVIINACPENLSLEEMLVTTRDPNKAPSTKARAARRVSSVQKKGKDAEKEKPKLPLIVKVELQGMAAEDKDVSKFLAALKADPIIKSVELKNLGEEGSGKKTVIEEGKTPLREFTLHVEFRSDVDVLDVIDQTSASKKSLAAGDKNPPSDGGVR